MARCGARCGAVQGTVQGMVRGRSQPANAARRVGDVARERLPRDVRGGGAGRRRLHLVGELAEDSERLVQQHDPLSEHLSPVGIRQQRARRN